MATLVLAGISPAESYVEGVSCGTTIRRGFRWKHPVVSLYEADCYPVFNLTTDRVNGSVFRSMNDDTPPFLVNGSHLGGNHAIVGGRVTHMAHGKTGADAGSVWAKGGQQFVMIRTLGTNQVLLAQIGSDVVPTAGTFTHVSGAVNTSPIVGSAVTPQFFFPMIGNLNISVSADGAPITVDSGTWTYSDNVSFLETYDVFDREDVLAWFISNGSAGGVAITGTPLFSVSNEYVFDAEANLTIYTDFEAKKTLTLNAIYGVQMQQAGATEYCIPKAKPLSGRDYGMIATASAPSSTMNFTPSNAEPSGLMLDRFITRNASHAMAAGFAPVLDAEPAVRRSTMATDKGLQIATSSKVYMRAVDNGGQTLNDGDGFSFIAYRNVFPRSADRTSSYVVRTREGDFFFADWHSTSKIDRVPIPQSLWGRTFTALEKSPNVDVLSRDLAGSLAVNVSAAGGSAYLVLKLDS